MIVAVVAVLVFVPHAAVIFAVVFLALVFGLLLDVPVSVLTRRGVSRGLGTTGVVVVTLGMLTGLGLWLVPALTRDVKSFAALHHSLPTTLAHRLNAIGRHLPVHFHVRASQLQFSYLTHYVSSHHMISGLGVAALAVLAAMVIAVWAVAAPELLARRALDLLAPTHREAASHLCTVVAARLRRWLFGQCIINLYAGVASFALFELLRVPDAPLFALAAVVLDVIPTFGVLIASAGPVLLLLADAPGHLVWLVIGLVVVYQVEDRLVIPHVMGRAAGLPQAVIAFVMFVFGIVWGPGGVIMAVPVTATLMAVVAEWRAGSVPGTTAHSRLRGGGVLGGDTADGALGGGS